MKRTRENNDERPPSPSLAIMPREVVLEILSFLPLDDLKSCKPLCKSLHAAWLDPLLWKGIADRTYGKDVVESSLNYYPTTYRAMVLDDNKLGAMPTITNRGIIPCRWKHNTTNRYYICLIMSVTYHRPSNMIRVYIDARGESDLRSPASSTMQLKQPQPPSRSSWDEWGAVLVEEAAAVRGRSAIVDLEEVQPPPPPPLIRGTFASIPAGQTYPRGHYKGYLSYDASQFTSDGEYVFTFADPRTTGSLLFFGGPFEVDYPSVPILEMPEQGGNNVLEAFVNTSNSEEGERRISYTSVSASPFDGDTQEREVNRFAHYVENDVLDRGQQNQNHGAASMHRTFGRGQWWA